MDLEKATAYLKRDEAEVGSSADDAIQLPEDQEPVLRNLGNGLVVSYVVDNGESFEYVQKYHLRDAEISEDQLHEIGVWNLAGLLNEQLEVHETEGVYAVFMDGNFEASLLCVDPLWDQSLAKLTTTTFTACAPTRDVLAFCDSASKEGVAKLREVISRLPDDADHPLVPYLLVRTENGWQKEDA